jgi:hypothetical protein
VAEQALGAAFGDGLALEGGDLLDGYAFAAQVLAHLAPVVGEEGLLACTVGDAEASVGVGGDDPVEDTPVRSWSGQGARYRGLGLAGRVTGVGAGDDWYVAAASERPSHRVRPDTGGGGGEPPAQRR